MMSYTAYSVDDTKRGRIHLKYRGAQVGKNAILDEDIPVALLQKAAAELGEEAKRKAIAAGIDVTKKEVDQRRNAKIDQSRWKER
jgi:hypothetical protein